MQSLCQVLLRAAQYNATVLPLGSNTNLQKGLQRDKSRAQMLRWRAEMYSRLGEMRGTVSARLLRHSWVRRKAPLRRFRLAAQTPPEQTCPHGSTPAPEDTGEVQGTNIKLMSPNTGAWKQNTDWKKVMGRGAREAVAMVVAQTGESTVYTKLWCRDQ